ncbi:helix-turn-helix domain-containing protein [Klenkia brasiliensis]|uniref:Helix-turn-helix domain-containing protein n=1 Tax=Klenkia brasiliensis TaxID=333142 RepID=A0A1G7YIB2_9ACTN|nr:helix-turn-helix transcriptional regulator [Klenkia brasiliensis]SDG96243.1 Helix-turn-helix domain-containing protein [Klenkia brasiliensis]
MSQPLPQLIRAARERARLSQAEVAAAVGVSLRTVGNWERGESIPRNRLGALEELLGVVLREGTSGTVGPTTDDAAPDLPVGAGVDPELLTQLAQADPEALEAVRAVLRAARRGD